MSEEDEKNYAKFADAIYCLSSVIDDMPSLGKLKTIEVDKDILQYIKHMCNSRFNNELAIDFNNLITLRIFGIEIKQHGEFYGTKE